MNGAFLKRAAMAALLVGATGVPRAEAQVSGGVSRIIQPPVNRPDPNGFRKGRERLYAHTHVPVPYPVPGSYNSGDQYQTQQPAPLPKAADKQPEVKALAATGVINNEGEVEWPLGIKVLPGDEVARLRIQLGAMFQVLAGQMVQGTVNPLLPVEINQAVDRMAALLNVDRNTRRSLTSANLYEESSRFLSKMREATRIAQAVQPAGESNPYLASQTGGGAQAGGGVYAPRQPGQSSVQTGSGVYAPAQPIKSSGKNPY
jgi:hypothetical protein